MPEAGWAVELRGDAFDLGGIREDLQRPFDPWSEDYDADGVGVLLLRTNEWDGMETAAEVMEHAGRFIEALNGAKLIHEQGPQPVTLGALYRFDAAGERIPIKIELRADLRGSAQMRARLSVERSDAPSPSPEPSVLQLCLRKALHDPFVADALTFVSRADNWFDLYKAMETASSLSRRGSIVPFPADWERAKETANWHRHSPSKRLRVPPEPMTLPDAKKVVEGFLREILGHEPQVGR